MSNDELTYLIALCYLHYNNVRRTRIMLDQYGSAFEAWKHVEQDAHAALKRAKQEMEFIEKHQITTFDYRDSNYPDHLRECPDAPVLLFGKGNLHVNEGKFVSIVGTRAASDRGKEFTRQLVLDLAQRIPNLTIVSGLAYGIDVAAHRAALEAGIPTIIVPAHGLDRIYPTLHRPVAIQALENGGILTEYLSNTEPERYNFVARNRIVAGLADAVVVTESKQRGGSLITAQMACDYSRDLFAVPGRINDANSIGCNELIRDQKAALINSADDLIRYMQWDEQTKPIQTEIENLQGSLTDEQQQLIQLLRNAENGIHINSIVMETKEPYAQVASDLMLLEMDGWVRSLPGGMYRSLK